MALQNLRGFRDYYPDLMADLQAVFKVWREVSQKFGYEEFDGPALESAQLWQLKSGAEIPDQMYNFEDKSGNQIAVRPELTPTLARMVAAKQKECAKPIRWFSIPRCWRYEAPQAGRLREFFQFNMDCLGSTSMKADAEVIMNAIDIMRAFGCTSDECYIRLGNRRLIQALIIACGIGESKLLEVSRLIDKKDKLSSQDFEKVLADLGVSKDAIAKLNALFEMKLDDVDPLTLSETGQKGLKEFKELMVELEKYDALDFIEVDFSIMRGFDYYTSTVFEVFARKGNYRAIAGGGRYDDLVSDFGGDPCPGVGYAMGDTVVSLFLKEIGKFPQTQRGIDYLVVAINADVEKEAIQIVQKLRQTSTVMFEITGKKVGKALNYADTMGARKVVIVGPRELAEGNVSIKDLESGEEQTVKIDSL